MVATDRSPRDEKVPSSTADLAAEPARGKEEVSDTVLKLLREVEDVRRENSRLQEKLCKAKSLMVLVQRQADEARAERDRERLRAESFQKSSQQLMRQLKRETAKVRLIERHLSSAGLGLHGAERGKAVELQDLSDMLSRSEPHDGSERKQADEAGGVGPQENQCVEERLCALNEAAARCNNLLLDIVPSEATADWGTASVGSSTTPCSGAGKLPELDMTEDTVSSSVDLQKTWEFVVQGQHSSRSEEDFAAKMLLRFPEEAVERALGRGVAFICSRGRRLDHSVPNQDDFVAARHTLVHGGHIALYGVFDGHGQAGHHCAAFARGALPESLFGQRTLLLQPEDTLREAFRATQAALLEQPFDTEHSGTTAAVALVLRLPASTGGDEEGQDGETWLFVAHVGDSRAILASHRCSEPSTAFTVTALTRDHRADNAEEAERIRQHGGEIRRLRESSGSARVFACNQDKPGLALTRCLGAASATQCGVTAEPEVSAYRLRPGVDVLLMLGTDGLFEFCSNTSAVGQLLREGVSVEALETLCASSRDQWARSSFNETVDDITVIAAALHSEHVNAWPPAATAPQ